MKKLILILSLFILTSCVETVVVGTAVASGLVLKEEKVSDTISDITMKKKIKSHLKKNSNHLIQHNYNDINVHVIEGRVLLTGTVSCKTCKKDAYKLVWESSDKIKEVINELKIKTEKEKRNKFRDSLITNQVKAKFKAKKSIKSLNYDVITVDKTVYIFGIAQNYREMRLTAKSASRVGGVKEVVSHVVLKYDERR